MTKLHLVLLSIGISAITFVEAPLHSNIDNTALAQGFSWGKIFQSIFSPQPPIQPRKGGSRGDICMVSPDLSGEPRLVWSDKPLFLWRGNFQKIGISSSKELVETNIFPRQISKQNDITYDGEPLKPGQNYYWWLAVGNSPNGFIPFKVMEPQQRQRIANELQKLEQQQKAQKATVENIALAKANYFLNQQPPLWSDALQQAYSVKNPSPELFKMRASIIEQLCK